jgi:NADH dehydrogenase FAD-containing subunit
MSAGHPGETKPRRHKHLVVVGGGFAGTKTPRALERTLPRLLDLEP